MPARKLRVLCQWTAAGPSYVRSGWGRVFKACGHDFMFWDPSAKPTFDAFSEAERDGPLDIFIGTTYDLDRAVRKCIRSRPHMKVALFASAWGPLADSLDPEKYPIVRATELEKARLSELKIETGKPDFVFIHAAEPYLEGVLGGWRSVGIEPVSLLNAADLYQYGNGKRKPELACDAFFAGGRWGYKSRNLDPFLLPLCNDPSLKVRISSRSPWGVPQHIGMMGDDDVRDSFASALVCPNVSEPHSTAEEYGSDTVERPFKALAAGGFVVSDYVKEAAGIFGDGVVFARTPKEFHEAIRHYARHPAERVPIMEKGRKTVLASHTYHHRVFDMVSKLGFSEEAMQVMSCLSSLTGTVA